MLDPFVAEKIKGAKTPEDLFGLFVGDEAFVLKAIHSQYRYLIRSIHPDLFPGKKDQAIASDLKKRIDDLESEAKDLVKAGTYGKPRSHGKITICGKEYDLNVLTEGVIAKIFLADNQVVKVSKTSKDNDLLEKEADNIREVRMFLESKAKGAAWLKILPEITSSFQIKTGSNVHRVNVMTYFDNMITLEETKKRIGQVDGRTSGWMWKRIISFLEAVHQSGRIHGSVHPGHLLIRPDNFNTLDRDPLKHAVVFVDWCYSTKLLTRVTAWESKYSAFYAPEIRSKNPVSKAADIYMAAKTILYMVGGDMGTNKFPFNYPPELSRIIGACLDPLPTNRPTLEACFKETLTALEKVYGPPKWHNLIVPK